MKKMICLSLLGMGLALPGWSQDLLVFQESPDLQVEFIRKLRKKGHPLLAKEYTEMLLKTADKSFAPMLQLEKARTSLAMALEGGTAEKKAKMLEEAKSYFEPFVKNNPNSPAGVQARLELAKLYSIQAQTLLNKALAEDEFADKNKAAAVARAVYDQADAEFDAAVKTLTQLVKTDKKWENDLYQLQFDRANNMIDKAQAFLDLDNSDQNRKRAETVYAAQKIFLGIAKDKETPQGLLANAYLVKCFQEQQDPPKVLEHASIVANASGKWAEPAQRLFRYFDILYIPKSQSAVITKLKPIERLQLMTKEINKWLQDYPGARKTWHGESIRFEQALTYLQMGGGLSGGFDVEKYTKLQPKDKSQVDNYLKDAEKVASELKGEDGDFGDRATRLWNTIQLLKVKLPSAKGVATVDGKDSFDRLYLLFQVEMDKVRKAEKAADKTKSLRSALDMLEKALDAGAKEKVSLAKIHEAQFLQGALYNGINDHRRAAIAFENLARAQPPSKKGADAAAYAIELYKTFADKDNDEAARYRLHDLGEYVLAPEMQQLWKGDKVIGFTLYNLGMDLLEQKKIKQAIEKLSLLPKDFPAYTYAQGQSVFIALRGREEAETPDDKKPWTEEARKAVSRLGPLSATADPTSALMWFFAKAEYPKILYADAASLLREDKFKEADERYKEMDKAIDDIKAVFDKQSKLLAKDKAEQLGFTLQVLDKYARLGQGDIAYRGGNYDRVLSDELLGTTVKELIKTQAAIKPTDPIKVKDTRVMGESLSLALRAYVQKGNIDAAKAMYALLLRLQPEAGGAEDNSNFTRALVADLAEQVEKLKERKDTVKLKEMVSKFGAFADELAKQLVINNKNPDVRDIKNMSRFFTSLEMFAKGADLYKKVNIPKHLEQKGGKFTEDQETELIIYWDLQVEHGRLLRKAKEYKEANKVLGRVLTHPNAKLQTLAEMEQISIYEDMESYGTAIKLWKTFMENLQRANIANNKRLKDLYFEGFYRNVMCYYRYSQTDKVKAAGKSDQFLAYAANQIVRLEASMNRDGWNSVGAKFEETLGKEKALKEAYERAKRK